MDEDCVGWERYRLMLENERQRLSGCVSEGHGSLAS